MEQLKTMTALFIGGGFGTILRYGLSKIGNPLSDHFFLGYLWCKHYRLLTIRSYYWLKL